VRVASGLTLADGKNESISYQPLVAGSYRVSVTAEPAVVAAVETHRELIAGEALADDLEVAEGRELSVRVEKADAHH